MTSSDFLENKGISEHVGHTIGPRMFAFLISIALLNRGMFGNYMFVNLFMRIIGKEDKNLIQELVIDVTVVS